MGTESVLRSFEKQATNERQRRRIQISPDFLLYEMTGGRHGWEVVEHALPEDVTLLGQTWDQERLLWDLLIWSASFEPIEAGECAPLLPSPVLRRIEP